LWVIVGSERRKNMKLNMLRQFKQSGMISQYRFNVIGYKINVMKFISNKEFQECVPVSDVRCIDIPQMIPESEEIEAVFGNCVIVVMQHKYDNWENFRFTVNMAL
jgi:hypothetical protein